MTRRERIEARLEKRREWQKSRAAKAEAGFDAAWSSLRQIPPGQPILVGHHSERRHRRDLERHDSKMRAAFESQDMAKRHEQVAETLETALDTSIFSDDANAVEALEARIKELDAERDGIKAWNASCRKRKPDPSLLTASQRENRLRAEWIAKGIPFPAYVLSNLGGRITNDRKRLEQVKRQAARAAEAEAAPGGLLVNRHPECNWCVVTFAEKPSRATIDSLKAAGYRWGGGSWQGYLDHLPNGIA